MNTSCRVILARNARCLVKVTVTEGAEMTTLYVFQRNKHDALLPDVADKRAGVKEVVNPRPSPPEQLPARLVADTGVRASQARFVQI